MGEGKYVNGNIDRCLPGFPAKAVAKDIDGQRIPFLHGDIRSPTALYPVALRGPPAMEDLSIGNWLFWVAHLGSASHPVAPCFPQ